MRKRTSPDTPITPKPTTIIRVVKDRNNPYTMINRRLLENGQLSFEARGMLAYLLSKPDDWVPNNEDLKRNGNIGDKQLARILRELKDTGHLHRERHNRPNGRYEWVTMIYEIPQPYLQNSSMAPYPQKACMDKAGMDEASMDNGGIYLDTDQPNTEILNTESVSTHTRASAPVTSTSPAHNPAVTVTSPSRTTQRPHAIKRAAQLTPVMSTGDSFDTIPAAGASRHSDQERTAVADLFVKTYPLRNGVLTDTPEDIQRAFLNVPRDAYYDIIRGAEHYAASAEAQRGIVMSAVRWILGKQWQRWQAPEQPKPTTTGGTPHGYESKAERNERILRARIARWQAEGDAGTDDHPEPRRLPA